MMKIWFVMSFVFLVMFSLFQPVEAAGTELMNSFSFRMTLVENGTEYQWEYDSPNAYEFEYGERVIKGEEAKKKVEEMFRILKLTEEEKVETLVKRVKDANHPSLERLDIRYMNADGKLYTWVWQNNQ